jgi:hypothetical protein
MLSGSAAVIAIAGYLMASHTCDHISFLFKRGQPRQAVLLTTL